MEQVMLLPVQPDNNEQYRPVRLIYGTFAGIVALLLWIISLTIQDRGLMDLIQAGRSYLDVLSGFMVDLQIVYQIVAGLFPSEIFSLFLSIQFIFIVYSVHAGFCGREDSLWRINGRIPGCIIGTVGKDFGNCKQMRIWISCETAKSSRECIT